MLSFAVLPVEDKERAGGILALGPIGIGDAYPENSLLSPA
jgi:hypothetical protein